MLTASVVGLCAGVSMLQFTATAQDAMVEAPIFEVDPLWPKPMPNEGLLGMTIGASVDAQDNVWIVHRGASTLHNNEKGAELNPPIAICCRAAPPVIAFNPDGDVIHAWGGAGTGLRVAGIDARRACRLTRATSGLAATARRIPRSSSSPRMASS